MSPKKTPVTTPVTTAAVVEKSSSSEARTRAFRLEKDGDIGILWFDLPGEKVNKFSSWVITELDTLLDSIAGMKDLTRLVIASGKPAIFIAGADVTEFTKVASADDAVTYTRFGQQVFTKLSKLPQITVAAIRGACMGGGTELALNCDYRVATDGEKTAIALPEVKLGIIPAWTGTTKLPRLVGLPAALDMILTGKNINARKALAMGLVDEVIPESLYIQLATKFARESKSKRRGKTRAHFYIERNPLARKIIFGKARKSIVEKTGGHYPAALKVLEVMDTGFRRGVEAGLQAEAHEASLLITGEVAQNLVRLFFLMEAAKKDTLKAGPRDVHKAGVLGAGLMGGGIAQIISDKANIQVRVRDLEWPVLAGGMRAAAKLFQKQVDRKKLRRYDMAQKLAQITTTTGWSGFRNADVTIEAVVEKLEVKQHVLVEFENTTNPEAIFATNTSTIPIAKIAAGAKRPHNVVGMHFFSPVDKMPLVEIIRGPKSSDEAIATVAAFARKLGKTVVHCKDAPGFVVNRILAPYLNEAAQLVEQGWDVESIDRAMIEFGMPMGPLHLLDEVGIDVAAKAAGVLAEAFPDRMAVPKALGALVGDGRHGKKNGKGVYIWKDGKKQGVDASVYRLMGARPQRRDKETPLGPLVEQMVLAMVNEASRVLDEKVVASAGELDLAMIMGTGFPPFRGGLARYADGLGIPLVVARLADLEQRLGPRFAVSAALQKIAAAESTFYATYPRK